MTHYTFTVIKDGQRESKVVEAADKRAGWKLTGYPNELKRNSSVALTPKNTYLYDESKNRLALRYVDNPESIEGARLFTLVLKDSFAGFAYNVHNFPVYFLRLTSDNVYKAYLRPKTIETSPEDFYDATQWDTALDIFKNTTPLLEKITTIIWAAAGLMSLMVLFMLIFAKGV